MTPIERNLYVIIVIGFFFDTVSTLVALSVGLVESMFFSNYLMNLGIGVWLIAQIVSCMVMLLVIKAFFVYHPSHGYLVLGSIVFLSVFKYIGVIQNIVLIVIR
jgi:hypothetical protein